MLYQTLATVLHVSLCAVEVFNKLKTNWIVPGLYWHKSHQNMAKRQRTAAKICVLKVWFKLAFESGSTLQSVDLRILMREFEDRFLSCMEQLSFPKSSVTSQFLCGIIFCIVMHCYRAQQSVLIRLLLSGVNWWTLTPVAFITIVSRWSTHDTATFMQLLASGCVQAEDACVMPRFCST